MPPAIRQQFRGWQRQWAKSGKTFRLLDDGGNRVTIQGIASDAEEVDPNALLGADPRELSQVEFLGAGFDIDYAGFAPLPDSVRSGSVLDDEYGQKYKAVRRKKNNTIDFVVDVWLQKIVAGIDK
jgi:hypothetical protein